MRGCCVSACQFRFAVIYYYAIDFCVNNSCFLCGHSLLLFSFFFFFDSFCFVLLVSLNDEALLAPNAHYKFHIIINISYIIITQIAGTVRHFGCPGGLFLRQTRRPEDVRVCKYVLPKDSFAVNGCDCVCDCYCDRDEALRGVPSSDKRNVRYCSTCARGRRDSCGGCGWCAECRTVVSDANTGNGGRMTDVPNVDESVVNDVTQGGIMTEVRTDVIVNDGKDDRVANDDSGDSEVLTDVCNDAEYGVYENGDGSTMDKVVCSDVEFETDESKEGGEVVDVCIDINVENDTNDMNENDMKRSGSVVADVCNANIEIDVNRSGKVVVEVCSNANIENDRNRSGGVVSDMCDYVNIEKDMNRSEGIVVDVCTDVSIEKDVRRGVGVSTDVCSEVCNEANTKNDVNRSGGIAVDVCNNVNIENGMNMSGGVLIG